MRLGFLFSLTFLLTSSLYAIDPLESLIDAEKKPEISEENSDLPPMFFMGDKNAVKIYSPGTRAWPEAWVCRSLELDELVQMSHGDVNAFETELNLDILRVRKIFEDACLIRKDDFLMALMPGFQTPVTVKRFFVRKEPRSCPQESPYTLWAGFDEVLEQSPLLFSTDLDLPEGDNHLKYLKEIPHTRPDENTLAALKRKIPFIEEFTIESTPLNDPDVKMLIHARRKIVETEDDGLPNELLFVDKEGEPEEIWVERVDLKKGSGHIRPLATWNINGDEKLDVLIEGDHQNCPYLMLLRKTEEGFVAESIPNEPCECQ